MAHPLVVEPGRVQAWKRKTIKQHLLNCIWDQLSNRSIYSQTVPKSKERLVPTTVVHKVSDSFATGVQSTTCLWVGRPQFKPIAGPNKAEGKERKLTTKTITIHYNIQRYPIAMNDRSVGGDLTKFYALAEKTADVIKDLFVETTEYDHERAICEGADEWLTESEYWEDSEYDDSLSTPVTKVLHPNIWVHKAESGTEQNTWSITFATAIGNLSTLCLKVASTDTMTIGVLDLIHLKASRAVNPIGGYSGNNEVKWIFKMSDAAWYQLTSDTTANTSWKDLLKYTDKGFDMMLHGHVGVYKNMLIVVSQRQPIFKCDASSGEEFQYVTPAGDGRTRSQTTNKSTEDGTMEVSQLLGLGAVSLAEIEEVDYIRKGFDYDFSEGMTGARSRGTQRTDLDTGNALTPTTSRINESSQLHLTASTTASA